MINCRTAEEGRTASPCQIWSKSVKPRPKYGDFSIFQDGGRRHLGFLNFKLLTVGQLWRVEVRRRAKFGQNRSKRGGDMAIFRFFNMAAVRHLGFVMCVFGPPTKGIWWSLSLCKIWLESMQ